MKVQNQEVRCRRISKIVLDPPKGIKSLTIIKPVSAEFKVVKVPSEICFFYDMGATLRNFIPLNFYFDNASKFREVKGAPSRRNFSR